jgi:TfoX/Sxy family transcriptional regulator of competence genes
MPYDPGLAQRLDDLLEGRPGFQPKRMFGGIGWPLNGNICRGVSRGWLVVRAGTDAAQAMLARSMPRPWTSRASR